MLQRLALANVLRRPLPPESVVRAVREFLVAPFVNFEMYDITDLFNLGVGGPILLKYAGPHEHTNAMASLQSGDECIRNRALQNFVSAGDAVEHVKNRLIMVKQQALLALELVTQAEAVFSTSQKFHEKQHMLSNHEDIPFTQHTDKTLEASCKSIDWKGNSTALLASSTLMKWTICGTPTG